MGLNKKRKHYVKIDRDTESNKVIALFDEPESNKGDDIDNLYQKIITYKLI